MIKFNDKRIRDEFYLSSLNLIANSIFYISLPKKNKYKIQVANIKYCLMVFYTSFDSS